MELKPISLLDRIQHHPWVKGFPEPKNVEEATARLTRINRQAGGFTMQLIASSAAIRHRPERGHQAPGDHKTPVPVADADVKEAHWQLRMQVEMAVARSLVLRRWIAERTQTEADLLAPYGPELPDELLAELVDVLLAARKGAPAPGAAAVLRRAVEHVKRYRALLALPAEAWQKQSPAQNAGPAQ